MARKQLIRQNQYPYHVYIRSNNKDWFQIPMYRMWDICYECLVYANDKCPVEIHSFVLMANHYHMLITTPNEDLDKFMEFFNRRLSQKINSISEQKNHKFANGYKWTIINSQNYLYTVYRYIYQNP
ncbi:MAG: transposase, partial [Flavobacteriaceae bacterium]|nr:transposase [Flavobacteriaceae bacterium]